MATQVNQVEVLPSIEELSQNFALATQSSMLATRKTLHRMADAPPQALLIEGGTVEERFAIALWQAAYLNCLSRVDDGLAPCLCCHSCITMGAFLAPHIHLLDGRTESIKIAAVRALRPLFAEAPQGLYRIIILAEAQSLGIAAANALLKSLEEPQKQVCFMLLTPQREQLLPTLVSRSWILTLPWPTADMSISSADDTMLEWESILVHFFETGQGFFAQTSVKGVVTAGLVRRIILFVQKTLVNVNAHASCGDFGLYMKALSPAACLHVQDVARQAELSLLHKVSPSLVLEWFVTQILMAYKRSR